MRIDTRQVLKDFYGKPIFVDDRPLTVGDAIARMLGSYATSDGKEQLQCYQLGTFFIDLECIELSVGQVALLDKIMTNKPPLYNPIILGQLRSIMGEEND